jgi:galactose mutarotase-like enzyme
VTDNMITLSNGTLTAAINPLGAELSSLKDSRGHELMHDGDPASWNGRAPLLFPIVGQLAGDRYRLHGAEYALPRHGFARRNPFVLAAETTDSATFRLTDTAETRAVYPFAFTLDVTFRLTGATLTMTVSATNHGDHDMPASFGFHPAFAWPLPFGAAKAMHRILFDQEEPEPLKELVDGVIVIENRPTPVHGKTLMLEDDLFAADALIWEGLASEKLLYGAPGHPHLEIAWGDMPNLGIWTKPGAPFVCIEPWAGIADRKDFHGEIWDKPGIWRIKPGTTDKWWMSVTLTKD